MNLGHFETQQPTLRGDLDKHKRTIYFNGLVLKRVVALPTFQKEKSSNENLAKFHFNLNWEIVEITSQSRSIQLSVLPQWSYD